MKNILLSLFTLIILFPHLSKAIEIKLHPIQLATSYTTQDDINVFWISEKLDGVRGYWDGKNLYTRNGRKIMSPQWFTHDWPNAHIEGELWSKRNDFSFIVSCIKTQNTRGNCWQNMNFMIFDLPLHKGDFSKRIQAMRNIVNPSHNTHLKMIPQFKVKDETALLKRLDRIVLNEGEGLMLHHGSALYKKGRASHLLKLKKHYDDEAIVLEHISGKGKNINKLGALLIKNTTGKVFKIGSGFSDKERENPPKIGSIITYRYTGKTSNDIPRFARFLRIRNE